MQIRKYIVDLFLAPIMALYAKVKELEAVIVELTKERDHHRDCAEMIALDLAEANELIAKAHLVSVDEASAESMFGGAENVNHEQRIRILRMGLDLARDHSKAWKTRAEKTGEVHREVLRDLTKEKRMHNESIRQRDVLHKLLHRDFKVEMDKLLPGPGLIEVLQRTVDSAEAANMEGVGSTGMFDHQMVRDWIRHVEKWFDALLMDKQRQSFDERAAKLRKQALAREVRLDDEHAVETIQALNRVNEDSESSADGKSSHADREVVQDLIDKLRALHAWFNQHTYTTPFGPTEVPNPGVDWDAVKKKTFGLPRLDTPVPTEQFSDALIIEAMLTYGPGAPNEPSGVFTVGAYQSAYARLAEGKVISGDDVRWHLSFRADIEQLTPGNNHYRYTGDKLPIPTAKQKPREASDIGPEMLRAHLLKPQVEGSVLKPSFEELYGVAGGVSIDRLAQITGAPKERIQELHEQWQKQWPVVADFAKRLRDAKSVVEISEVLVDAPKLVELGDIELVVILPQPLSFGDVPMTVGFADAPKKPYEAPAVIRTETLETSPEPNLDAPRYVGPPAGEPVYHPNAGPVVTSVAESVLAHAEAVGQLHPDQEPAPSRAAPVEAVLDRSTAQLPSYEPNPKACHLPLANLDANDLCPQCDYPACNHRNWIDTERKRGRVA